MADIKKLILNYKKEPYGFVDTSIGELCVFYVSVKDQMAIAEELGKPISKCQPIDFVRSFSKYICFPKSSLKEGKYKPDNPILKNSDISSMTENDLESIVKLYIENNEYLFKKELNKERKEEDGTTVHYIEYGEIEYPRNENESYIQYLTRLSIKEEEKHAEQMKKALGSFSSLGLTNFSNPLNESIKNSLFLGESFKKTLESIKPKWIYEKTPLKPVPTVDFSKIEESRLKPLNDIAGKLDKLIDTSVQTAEFIIETNKIQTGIGEELKLSSDKTTHISKINIVLTIIVILLSTISIGSFVYSLIITNKTSNNQRLEIQNSVSKLSNQLTDINKSITNVSQKEIELLENNLIIMNKMLNENDNLKKQLSEQSKIIDEMRKSKNPN